MKKLSAFLLVAQTGFLVSVISYIVFWTTDLARSGFVSRYFSVHLFLLAALVFAGWLLFLDE